MFKAAVFGSTSYLGKKFIQVVGDVEPFSKQTGFDLHFPSVDVSLLQQKKVTHALLFAAMTNVRACEEMQEESWQCNVNGPLEWARQIHKGGMTPVLFSSDYVFDGASGDYEEDSATYPLNIYGSHKKALELGLNEVCGENYLLIRLSKVF